MSSTSIPAVHAPRVSTFLIHRALPRLPVDGRSIRWRPDLRTCWTPIVKSIDGLSPGMESIELREETIERLDDLRIEDESYDELVTELINIYEAEELTMFHSGDG
jgi:hypothetical protein